MKKFLPFVIIAAVFIVALVLGIIFVRSARSPAANSNANSSSEISNSATSSTAPSNGTTASGPTIAAPGAVPPQVQGEPTAAVTMEEFGDYQCPPCGGLHPVLKQIEKDYGTRVRLIFRELPLTQIHKHAMEAARAAEAAGLQGKFWEMHDMIYEHQADWGPMPDVQPIFAAYARALDLNVEKWTRDLNGDAVNQRIIADIARADSLGVKGTPTLFINDKEVSVESMTPGGIRSTIDTALRAK